MDEKKADCVAVPTTDATPSPPPYGDEACQHGNKCCKKRSLLNFPLARSYPKVFWFGVSAAALFLLSRIPSFHHNEASIQQSPFDIPHRHEFSMGFPKLVPDFEYTKEFDHFLAKLNAAFGHGGPVPHEPPFHGFPRVPPPPPMRFSPECCLPRDDETLVTNSTAVEQQDEAYLNDDATDGEKKHEHKHGKHHHRKHGKALEAEKGCPCMPPPPRHGHGHPMPPPPPPPPGDAHPMPPPPEEGYPMPPPPLAEEQPMLPPPICPPVKTLNASSTIFTISPEQFSRAALYIGHGFPESGTVFLSKAKSAEAGADITVNVTLLYADEHAKKRATISAFDHEGQYVLELKRDLPPPHRRRHHHGSKHPEKHCLKYEINVVFPADMEAFEHFNLRARTADVRSCTGLQGVEFDKFEAGVGRGTIQFSGLKAKSAQLGVLSGHIRGNYTSLEKFAAGVVSGSTDVSVVPEGDQVKLLAAAVHGGANAEIPADRFEGNFLVHSLFGGTPVIQAPEPTDVHVEKYKHNLKAGYYKSKDTGSSVVVNAKHGKTKLVFAETA